MYPVLTVSSEMAPSLLTFGAAILLIQHCRSCQDMILGFLHSRALCFHSITSPQQRGQTQPASLGAERPGCPDMPDKE